MSGIRRREFISLLGGAVAAWPLVARAQQTGRVRRIAMLVGAVENDPEAPLSSEAFRQTLNQLGWKEGVSVRIDTRWGAGDPDRMHAYAKELIDTAPDVAVADSTPAALALHRESRTTPIIFIQAGDPAGGLIVMPDSFTMSHRETIVALASRYRVPTVYPFRVFAATGGLMSYGMSRIGSYRDAASYVDRVLRGEKPGDLPVQAPTT